MTMDHSTVIPIVIRFRLRSATPEDPIREERPPPNMSDTPPPRPLCIRIERTSSRLVITRITSKTMRKIGRASCRERVERWVGGVAARQNARGEERDEWRERRQRATKA